MEITERRVKQVIVIRRDLRMRRGKEIAQGAHASMMWLSDRLNWTSAWGEAQANFTPAEYDWLHNSFRKITCQVESEDEIFDLHRKARDSHLLANVVLDAGDTEFGGMPTVTAIAIGPDYEDRVDQVTGGLALY
jgi:peptidyl-tRNA hydrolase, PTH2 family